MSPVKLHYLMLATFLLILFKISSASAATASVYSVTSNPVFLENSLKVTTITRGAAANDAVYKVATQTVSKALMLSTFRKGLAFTPYGIAALAAWQAYDYYIDEDGDLLTDSFSVGDGLCNSWHIYDNNEAGCWANVQSSYPSSNGWTNTRQIVLTDTYGYVDYISTAGELELHKSYTFALENYNATSETVSDDDLWQQWIDYVNDNPTVDHTQAFYDETGQVDQDYFPDPEFSLYTEEDQVLIDLYGSGLLQSTDPAADNYVTPAEYARIADLYAEQNKTPEQQADELTADAAEPMTRDEYAQEQALKEERMQDSADSMSDVDLSGVDKTTEMNDQWDILDNMIQNPVDLPSSLPAMPTFDYSGSCQTIDLNWMGASVVFPTPSQCAKLNTGKDLIGYFLYVMFFWMISVQLFKEAN